MRGEVGLGGGMVNQRIVLVMLQKLPHKCVYIVNTYMPIHNDSNLQCTTHFKGNPYKC